MSHETIGNATNPTTSPPITAAFCMVGVIVNSVARPSPRKITIPDTKAAIMPLANQLFGGRTDAKITARAGLIVSAITSEQRRVVTITNGMDATNRATIPVMNIIVENIHTTVRVVDIRTTL